MWTLTLSHTGGLLICLLAVLSAQHSAASRHLLNATEQVANNVSSTKAQTLLKGIFDFQLRHGLDQEYGGWHATLDRQGKPISPTTKSVIQHGGQLYAMSALLMAGPETWGYNSSEVRAAADAAYDFMSKHLVKNMSAQGVPGGQAFMYEITRNGTSPITEAVNINTNAFAMYGLSAYVRATNSSDARRLALNTFTTIDQLYHSPEGGYNETNTGLTFDSIPLPSHPNNSSDAANVTNARSSSGSGNESSSAAAKPQLSQSLNTLTHTAEALAELSRATGDPNVTARLLELLLLMTGPMVVRPTNITSNTTPAVYLAPNYDPKTWRPVGPATVGYGQNIEVAWLMAAAVDELLARGAVDNATAEQMKGVLQELGEAAIAAGYDNQNGGLYEGTALGAAFPTKPNKVWWPQAESALGLDWLYNRTGNTTYKDKLEKTLDFTRSNVWDQPYGEWFWQVGPAGGGPIQFDPQLPADTKAATWKAAYHQGRAMLRLAAAGY